MSFCCVVIRIDQRVEVMSEHLEDTWRVFACPPRCDKARVVSGNGNVAVVVRNAVGGISN